MGTFIAFGVQIYHQTKITTSKYHECETSFIKMPIVCHPVNAKNAQNTPLEFVLFAAIESSMNGGSLSITGFGRSSL